MSMSYSTAKEQKVSIKERYALLSLTLLLIVLFMGDLSSLLGSPAYWAITTVLVLLIYALHSKRAAYHPVNIKNPSLLIPFAGAVLFFIALITSGIINNNLIDSFKFVTKYAVIIAIAALIYRSNITPKAFIGQYKVALIFFSIYVLISLIFFRDSNLIQLGDGRIGTTLSYPGVLWKSGCYLFFFTALAVCFSANRYTISLLFVTVSIIAIDGSRTGIVWLLTSAIALPACLYLFEFKNAKYRNIIFIIVTTILAYSSLAALPDIAQAITKAKTLITDTTSEKAEIEETLSIETASISERFNSGDNIRFLMLQEGLESARDNFWLGGGVGTTSVPVDGIGDMVVHMTYLQLIGDIGFFGLIGYLAMFWPVFHSITLCHKHKSKLENSDKIYIISLAAMVLLYLTKGLLHPVSNEISDLGIAVLALSVLFTWNLKVAQSVTQ